MWKKQKELLDAIMHGRLDDVKRLVEEKGVNPNYDNGFALRAATLQGHTNAVDYLLKKNASTEFCTPFGYTPLIFAAQHNYLKIVRLLLDANADINAKTNYNKTALDIAVEEGHNDVAQLLRSHPQRKINNLLPTSHERIQDAIHLIKEPHTDVNLRDGNFVPLLHLVTDTGNMELLQTLLEEPALDVNATDKDEQMALARAMAKNDMAAVVALLKANASLGQLSEAQLRALIEADLSGNALLQAASTNNASRVEGLILAGVRPGTTNKDGASALHVAAANGNDAIVQLLLAKDASLSLQSDHRGNLPLHLAAAHGHLTIVDHLLKDSTLSSGLDCTNNAGEEPLFAAAKTGHDTVVKRLLEAKAKTNTTATDGSTLLHAAALGGSVIILRHLRSHFSTVDVCDERGQTPLHVAAKQGHDTAVQFLLGANASVFATSSDDATPRMLATAPTVLTILRDAEARAHAEERTLANAIGARHWKQVQRLMLDGVAVTDADDVDTIVDEWLATGDPSLLQAIAAGPKELAQKALHAAAVSNKVRLVMRLLHASSSDLDVVSNTGPSPLHGAAREGKTAVLTHLLARARVPINTKNEEGYTALALAVRNNKSLSVQLLLSVGADPMIPMPDGTSLVQMASAGLPTTRNVLAALFETFGVVLAPDDAPWDEALAQALVHAVRNGDERAVRCLLDADAKVSTLLPNGQTLLAAAIQADYDAIARLLFQPLYPEAVTASLADVELGAGIFSHSNVLVVKATYQGKAAVLKGPTTHVQRIADSFQNEVDNMRVCSSPYVLPLLAILDTKTREPLLGIEHDVLNSPAMVMEYMDQGDLSKYLKAKRDGRPLALELSTIEVALVVARALADLHRRNMMHRDVKSLNIFLSRTHYIRLGDLGSARTLDPNNTMTSNAGTPYWIAPEVLRDPEHAGEGRIYTTAADIYSFGVVLTELDTRDVPYHDVVGPKRGSILSKVLAGELRPTMSATCPRWLHTLANQCMAFDPTNRPTADAIVQELLLHRHDDAPARTDGVLVPSPNTSATA
ncbi:serine/threonine protein kinase [Saprolegnia parasitica CBS 223.65]|uniref:Serine/threonine protein kinase n=1 Tax=Saprolegnia parasitica (strain CBS 223.65) TaxID=695850 RepID=A0A067BJV0_SAPPC|nr:serine/threonine protein kinase [Saprolegnia parasitica CBS 223.65]KDO18699.1 serine/threonine protein kinase [Saprolegnia parasitica CBS 223.65]|eukprot:XP_012210592.1 serine/threonine protein kinase [Saprolegnia parasitica CBS 223.65]